MFRRFIKEKYGKHPDNQESHVEQEQENQVCDFAEVFIYKSHESKLLKETLSCEITFFNVGL